MALGGADKGRGGKKLLFVGAAVGGFLTLMAVIASAFIVEATSTDAFCTRCHVMVPFKQAWEESVHGGNNPQGFKAQCTDCHLPHTNVVEYMVAKAQTGIHDVVANMTIDPATHDWMGNAEKNRKHFTFESACLHCHQDLTPPGQKPGGRKAHRAYLLGETDQGCVDCHPHVGHKEMADRVQAWFKP